MFTCTQIALFDTSGADVFRHVYMSTQAHANILLGELGAWMERHSGNASMLSADTQITLRTARSLSFRDIAAAQRVRGAHTLCTHTHTCTHTKPKQLLNPKQANTQPKHTLTHTHTRARV